MNGDCICKHIFVICVITLEILLSLLPSDIGLRALHHVNVINGSRLKLWCEAIKPFLPRARTTFYSTIRKWLSYILFHIYYHDYDRHNSPYSQCVLGCTHSSRPSPLTYFFSIPLRSSYPCAVTHQGTFQVVQGSFHQV